MDLGAYQQIENLESIAKENGIEIPRLRGYRLMKNEEPISKEKIENLNKECEISVKNPNIIRCDRIHEWRHIRIVDK